MTSKNYRVEDVSILEREHLVCEIKDIGAENHHHVIGLFFLMLLFLALLSFFWGAWVLLLILGILLPLMLYWAHWSSWKDIRLLLSADSQSIVITRVGPEVGDFVVKKREIHLDLSEIKAIHRIERPGELRLPDYGVRVAFFKRRPMWLWFGSKRAEARDVYRLLYSRLSDTGAIERVDPEIQINRLKQKEIN